MLVSVIIPCYNVTDYITECIKSVYNQSHKEIEVICIDNNSTDNTLNVLKKLKSIYTDLIIDEEKKIGANAARNKGLAIAKGEWVQFLDADDLLDTNKIEHQIDLMKNKSNIGFIAGAHRKQDTKGQQIILTNLSEDKYISTFTNKTGNTCSNFWKKESLLNCGLWNEELFSSQETELMLRLILNNENYIIDNEALTIVRERVSGQISQGNQQKKWAQYIEIRLNYLNSLKLKNITEYNKNKNTFFDYLMVSIFELAKYDQEKAITIYNKSIKNNWKSEYIYGLSRTKVMFIKAFGLKLYLKLITQS